MKGRGRMFRGLAEVRIDGPQRFTGEVPDVPIPRSNGPPVMDQSKGGIGTSVVRIQLDRLLEIWGRLRVLFRRRQAEVLPAPQERIVGGGAPGLLLGYQLPFAFGETQRQGV